MSSTLLQYSKIEIFWKKIFRKNYILKKNGPSNAPGPASALKSHNAEKLKGWTLWGFSTSILSQNMKKLKKTKIFIFGKKSHNAEKKTERGDPLGIFNIHSVAKHQKKCRGDPLGKNFFEKKVSQCRKKWKGGVFGLARYGMLRGKTGKTFLVQFARPNSAFWCNNIL